MSRLTYVKGARAHSGMESAGRYTEPAVNIAGSMAYAEKTRLGLGRGGSNPHFSPYASGRLAPMQADILAGGRF